MNRQQLPFITYYRILGTFFILLCHFTAQSSNPYIGMSSQFFNVGVEMFVILSGFVFGLQGSSTMPVYSWYRKRLKRIFIPFYLFEAVLLGAYLKKGLYISWSRWIPFTFGLQGTDVGILGAEQTWFITGILSCYLLTPILWKCRRKKIMWIVVGIPVLLALIPYPWVFTLGKLLCWYSVAFFLGRKWDDSDASLQRTNIALCFIIICVILRLLLKALYDGTIWYDSVAVGYTQAGIAFCGLYVLAYFFKGKKIRKLAEYLSDISFEVYLYHYMFCVGPVRLFSLTHSWFINCMFVTLITFFIAAITHLLARFISKRI